MKQLRAESFTLPLIKWVALGLSLYPPSFPRNRGNEADSSLRYSSVDVLSDRLTFPFWNRNVPPKRKALSRKPEHAQPEAADFKWFFQKKNKLRMKHWSYLYGDALGDYFIYTRSNVVSWSGNSCLKCPDKVTLCDNCILSTTSPQYLSKEVSELSMRLKMQWRCMRKGWDLGLKRLL